jgi:hypothetical protein
LLDTRSVPLIGVALVVMLVLQGAYIGTQPAVFSELFPDVAPLQRRLTQQYARYDSRRAPAPFVAAALFDAYITVLAVAWWLSVVGLRETHPRGSHGISE